MKRLFLSIALLPLASATHAAPIEGRWQNPKDSVIIDVAPCGGGSYCGKVSWASPKAKAGARKGGTERLVGMRLLTDLKPDGKGGWRGRAFLPKRNMHANAMIRPAGASAMIVKGCLLAQMICKEQRWTRAD
ncbi:MAG TPA: DUF2147 domain-containing protein [Sphingomicrobium sp.]|nr:DUF2147 domain-containing protein [Sphingomicrobium sp.]